MSKTNDKTETPSTKKVPRPLPQVTPAEFWSGSFGDSYLERNRLPWQDRVPFWQHIIDRTNAASFLEVGCNRGTNLQAIRSIRPDAAMSGVDINEAAVREALAAGLDAEVLPANEIVYTFGQGCAQLTFTAGVLIHIPPESLREVMEAIRDTASDYVLAIEYAADVETEVEYRGHKGKLWKRPFGELYGELGLTVIETGQAKGWPEPDVTYWLMERG